MTETRLTLQSHPYDWLDPWALLETLEDSAATFHLSAHAADNPITFGNHLFRIALERGFNPSGHTTGHARKHYVRD